jgi:ribonuclease HI
MIFEMYSDGSYNAKTQTYGGAYYISDLLEGAVSGNDLELAPSRNVAGECLAVIRGIVALSKKTALHPGDSIIVYHDYTGLAEWANGNWKTKQPVSQRYKASIDKLREDYGLIIDFRKVPAHSGITENEHVDQLAKQAVGLL